MLYKPIFSFKCSKALSNYSIRTLPKLNSNLDNLILLGKDKFEKLEKTEFIYKFRLFSTLLSKGQYYRLNLSSDVNQLLLAISLDLFKLIVNNNL